MNNLIGKIFMGLFGLMLMGLLFLGLALFIVAASLRWVFTGRKPQVVMVWQQFSTLRQNFQQGGFRRRAPNGFEGASGARGARPQAHSDDQVVDVEAKEVQQEAPLLPKAVPPDRKNP